MLSDSVWIEGASRSGKTTRLVTQLIAWLEPGRGHKPFYPHTTQKRQKRLSSQQIEPAVLVLAANDTNRRELAETIVDATAGRYPIRAKTPLGFFQDEVILFWPLLIQSLNLRAQFPVRLRPETEQELATRLWKSHLDSETIRAAGVNEYRLMRRILDLLQLAAYSGTPLSEIAPLLERGLVQAESSNTGIVEISLVETLLTEWRSWCLARGLLTYGIITELYYQHLLPDSHYQEHLLRRYRAVLADDVDEYPAIMRDLFEFLLDHNVLGAFAYNPDGGVRLGLGADPEYMAGLQARCRVESVDYQAPSLVETVPMEVFDSIGFLTLPSSVASIQTTSRRDLLVQTADTIASAVHSGQVQPHEIAVIAPGLDAIARYTLVESLTKQGIYVSPLNDQRALVSYPIVRALLTLLSFVYPGLGRLVERDAVAQMLVVLSRDRSQGAYPNSAPEFGGAALGVNIDPVRAGLIADHCYEPHPEQPNLLPITVYDRWDRLGYAATMAYDAILQWIEAQRSQQQQRLLPSPISLLDRAIQRFLWNGSNLPYDQLAALRELLETAQHYWEVDTRLRQIEATESSTSTTTIAQFIQLLRSGTITANPYPVRPIGPASRAVTLATIFQYRSSRKYHRWHFWLDAGSPLWLSGGAATLFGAPLFLHNRFARPWTSEDALDADQQRLQRILQDLLSRVEARVYLCHSDLAVNGQEQSGPLLSLVNATTPIDSLRVHSYLSR